MSNCFWIESVSDFEGMNIYDIYADWSGVELQVGDLVFLLKDGAYWFYLLDEFADTAVDSFPDVFSGPLDTDTGLYPIWRTMSLSYTLQSVGFAFTGTEGVNPDDPDEDRRSGYDLIKQSLLLDEVPFGCYDPVVTFPPNPSDTMLLNSATESLWSEEIGAELNWTVDRVQLDGVLVPGGGPFEYVNTQNTAKLLGGFAVKFGILNSASLYMAERYAGSPDVCFHELCEIQPDGTIVVKTSVKVDIFRASKNTETTGFHSTCRGSGVGGLTNQYYIVGYEDYTDTKTFQGYIELVKVNPDFSFTVELLDGPNGPQRNGYFGKYCAVIETATDVFVAANELLDEIHIFKESGGWVLDTTIALDRNDYVVCLNADQDSGRFYLCFYDDSMSANMMAMIYHNGSAWVLGATRAGSTYGTLFASPTRMVSFGSTWVGLYDVDPITHAITWLVSNPNAQVSCGDGSQVCLSGEFLVARNMTTYWNFTVWEVVGNSMIQVETIDPDHLVTYDFDAHAIDESTATPAANMIFSSSTLNRVYSFLRGDLGSYNDGHFYFSSDHQDTIIEMLEDRDGIHSAGVVGVEPAGSEIRFAISTNGTSWVTWGGSSNVALSSLADIKVNGSNYVNFEASLQALSFVPGTSIYFAFSLNRPAGAVDESETPSIESIWCIQGGGELKSTEWRVNNFEVVTNVTSITPGCTLYASILFAFLDKMK